MGEYADLMLEGHACAGCGEYFHDDEAQGFPRYCVGCEPDELVTVSKKFSCPKCGKSFKRAHPLAQHRAMKRH